MTALTIDGFENLANSAHPGYGRVRPDMLMAGDHAAAKTTVGTLCEDLDWQAVDAGALSSSLHLEHITLLWIGMGRIQGKGLGFVWVMLER